MHHAEFRHPTLVEVYDADCPWSRDDDFFCSVVGETPDARVLDLGCGTGRLALGLAARGHTVTGVDPAEASLDAARAKPGADALTWVQGSTEVLPERSFDVAVMTSHVAQFFDSAGFARALGDLHSALVPGGRLVFDTRDPDDRRWERWNPDESRHVVTLQDGRTVCVWSEVTSVELPEVAFTLHYELSDGSELTSDARLAFRPEREVREALASAGFTVEHVYGGWERQPVGHEDGELLVVARVPLDRAIAPGAGPGHCRTDAKRSITMPEFMDVHTSMKGVTPEALHEAHQADLAIQDDEQVNFKHAWADPESGMVFCLSEAPDAAAVQRIHERAGHPADHVYEVPVQA